MYSHHLTNIHRQLPSSLRTRNFSSSKMHFHVMLRRFILAQFCICVSLIVAALHHTLKIAPARLKTKARPDRCRKNLHSPGEMAKMDKLLKLVKSFLAALGKWASFAYLLRFAILLWLFAPVLCLLNIF